MLLKGKNVVITGAGRGIGKATAIHLGKEGANLGLIDINADQLEDTKKEIDGMGLGIKVSIKAADITNYSEVEASFSHIHGELGLINGVIANAGTTWKAPTHEIEPEKFQLVFNVNVIGVFHTFRAAYRFLKLDDKKDKARFVMAGSATYPDTPMPKQVAYTASKFAVIGMMRTLDAEYKSENITFNTLLPNMVDTRLLRGSKAGDGNKPPGVLDPEDLGDYYLFFLTDEASKLSNQEVDISMFETIKKLISEAPDDKKASWDVFQPYLEEKAPDISGKLRRLRRLAEFLLTR